MKKQTSINRLTAIKIMACNLLLCAVLAGCGTDKAKSLEIVKKTFPNSKVYQFPENNYIYYLVDSSGIKKVTCLNFTDDEIDGVMSALAK